MKKILAPTDFSNAAQNAVEYAAELASRYQATLVLFHAYHVPPISVQIPVVDPPLEEIRKQSLDALKTVGENLIQMHGGKLSVECDNRYGFAADEINDYALENDIDLIVMGMQGGNFISELVVGSITTSLMKDAPCPVLVIGREMPFVPVKKIAWASDGVKAPSVASLNQLKKILDLFPSVEIHLVNVVHAHRDDKSSFERRVLSSLQSFLHHENYTVHKVEHEDTVEGINHLVKELGADLVIMAPRRHATWRNLFFEPNTKRMAFHSVVPLLIIQP